ncbi:MAG: PUA domain-containing protein, partial [Spirochaetota bacterium]
GGMDSKLKAAEIAARSGVGVVIASGKTPMLSEILRGEVVGTYCVPSTRRIKGKKKWIAFNLKVEGKVIVDPGGVEAIVNDKKSLLPAGVGQVVGDFKMGSNISIQDEHGKEIARGLSNFSSHELRLIQGRNTRSIPQVLGNESYFEEVVHRDNMVVF